MVRTCKEGTVSEPAIVRNPTATPGRTPVLGGLPYRGSRALTRTEFWALALSGYGGAVVGGLAIFAILEGLLNGRYLAGPGNAPLLLLVCVPLAVVAATVTRPALRTLRRGSVDIFAGEVPDFEGYDQNQLALRLRPSLPIEVVTHADGRTPLRIGRRWSLGHWRLAKPARVAGDRGPLDRSLSEAEVAELRDLVRHFRTPSPSIIPLVVTLPAVILFFAWMFRADMTFLAAVLPTIVTVAFTGFWRRFVHYRAFARRLERDLWVGNIVEGRLDSGLPWLVDGEPAAWRLVRPKVGVHVLDASKLEELGR